jgi:hypothetical protein
LGGNPFHFSEDGLMPTLGLRGVLAAIKIRSDNDWGPAGRESDHDIIALVGRSLSASGSGLVPGTPSGCSFSSLGLVFQP